MNNYNNSNNASTTISAGISASATTLLVDNGAILPNAPFLLTLEHMDNEKVTVREIVKCTAKVGNSLTIVRSAGICVQDDTATPKVQNNTPHSFGVGDFASIYWTSEQVKDIQDEINQKLNITDFQAGTYVYSSSSTETDAYSITIPGAITSYQLGQVFRFLADVENTGNATLNVNGIGAIEILKNHDKHLESGDIEAGQIVEVAFDGTYFQMNSQVATVVSLEEINSLNYNDLTCYAGEDIKANDLIVTNGNSFNPDWADEGVMVGDSDINKYAIGFVGNGEATDTFSIKTSVSVGNEPDSVTINIESDDNGKPSGTVLATSTDLNVFKIRDNPSSITTTNISGLDAWYMNTLGKGEGKISFDSSTRVMTVSGYGYNYTLDLSSLLPTNTILHSKTSDDKYFMFGLAYASYDSFWLVHLPNPKTIEGATIQTIDTSIIKTATGINNAKLFDLCITDNGKYMFGVVGSGLNGKIYKITLTTPFVVDYYDAVTEQTTGTVDRNSHLSIINNFGKEYIFYYLSSPNYYIQFGLLDSNYTVSGTYNTGLNKQIKPDYRETNARYYCDTKELFFGYDWNYDGIYKGTITTTSVLNTVKGTKYWLTIAPVRTGSIVNCAVIYDKEGEYFSECAVKNLTDWSNVAGKTPYIDSKCIQARYALKSSINNIGLHKPYGFANGDFTNLESVKYCISGAKTGFVGLEKDTVYYSGNDGQITTTPGYCKVGKSTDEVTLIADIDNVGSPSFTKSYSGVFTDSFKAPCDGYIKYSFSVKYTTYSFVLGKTSVIDTKSGNQGSTASTVSLAYTFVPAGTTITLSTQNYNQTADVSGTFEFLSTIDN